MAKSLVGLWRKTFPEDEILTTSRTSSENKEEIFYEYDESSPHPLVASLKPNLLVNLISYMGDDHRMAKSINVNLPRDLLRSQEELNFHLVLFGSAAEYGLRTDHEPLRESSALRPLSAYGLSKVAQSELAEIALQAGAELTYVRVFNLFARDMRPNLLPGRLQKSTLETIAKNGDYISLARANDVRDFMHLDRLCSILIKIVALRSFAILNVATGAGLTVGEFADYFVHEILGISNVFVRKSFSSNPTYSIADVSKLKREINHE